MRTVFQLSIGSRTLELGKRTLIMGVVNVTPDSFSDGGLYLDKEQAVEHAQHLVDEGADIIDIGGESTRPGARPVPEEEELQRILPVIGALAAAIEVPLSVDTYKASVARMALEAGASFVNDVSAFRNDPEMAGAVAAAGVEVCLVHMKGEPRTMQDNPR